MKWFSLIPILCILPILTGCDTPWKKDVCPSDVTSYYNLIKDLPVEVFCENSGQDRVPFENGKRMLRYKQELLPDTFLHFEYKGIRYTAIVMMENIWFQEAKWIRQFHSSLLIFHGTDYVGGASLFSPFYGVKHDVRLKLDDRGRFVADCRPARFFQPRAEKEYLKEEFPQRIIDIEQDSSLKNELASVKPFKAEYYAALQDILNAKGPKRGPNLRIHFQNGKCELEDSFFGNLDPKRAFVFPFRGVNYFLIHYWGCGSGQFLLLYKGQELIHCWHFDDKVNILAFEIDPDRIRMIYNLEEKAPGTAFDPNKTEGRRFHLLALNDLRWNFMPKYPSCYLGNGEPESLASILEDNKNHARWIWFRGK